MPFTVKNYSAHYVKYIEGNMNLIITAPHGGGELPSSIPDRTPGCFSSNKCLYRYGCLPQNANKCSVKTLGDRYTSEMAELIFEHVRMLTKATPYLIINNLHRKKMDANREVNEATLGNSNAQNVYYEYHNITAKSCRSVQNQFGQGGLLIDIHGHSHDKALIELV